MAMQTTTLHHRSHDIKAGVLSGTPTANIFRQGVKGLCHRVTADSVDDAIAAARAWIDDWDRDRRAGRTRRGDDEIGSVADFEYALSTIRIGDAALAMLKAHYNAPDRILTATELSNAAGYADYAVANRLYGQLGKDVADAAELRPPASTVAHQQVWTGVLAHDAGSATDDGHFRWRMHDALATAIARLNMA